MSDPRAVMIFAAGFGTRMKDLTRDRPKPLIPVAGRALIDHTLALTDAVRPSRVVVNLHYKGQMLADHLASRSVALAWEQPDILDTGGGLKAALPLLGAGPVYTMNSDALWRGPNPLTLLQSAWEPERMDALLVCVPLGQTVGRDGPGDFALDDQNRIHRGGDLVYGGVQIIRTDAVEAVKDRVFSLNRVWNDLADRGRLFGLTYSGHWCDVGHPGGIALAEAMLDRADV